MKLTQQAHEWSTMNKEAGVETGDCGEDKLENN